MTHIVPQILEKFVKEWIVAISTLHLQLLIVQQHLPLLPVQLHLVQHLLLLLVQHHLQPRPVPPLLVQLQPTTTSSLTTTTPTSSPTTSIPTISSNFEHLSVQQHLVYHYFEHLPVQPLLVQHLHFLSHKIHQYGVQNL